MNTDIRLSLGFLDHPKTKKLRKRLGADAVLCLLRLWMWVAEYRPDGKLTGMDVEDIELASSWQGEDSAFVDALNECGWIDVVGDDFFVHDWTEHQQYACKTEERSDKARLKRLAQVNAAAYAECQKQGITGLSLAEYEQWKSYSPTTSQQFAGKKPASSQLQKPITNSQEPSIKNPPPISPPRGESGKEKRQSKKADETIQSVLDEQPDILLPVLAEFVAHRQRIKKPLTPHALRLNIKDLQKLAPDDFERQIYLVEYAIKKGWQGFYLPEEEKMTPATVPRAVTVGQQLRLEQDQQARALLAASQRRREHAQLIGDGRSDYEAESALPPGWGTF